MGLLRVFMSLRAALLAVAISPATCFHAAATDARTTMQPHIVSAPLRTAPLWTMAEPMGEKEACRMLGVTPDAAYEEIVESWEELATRYADDDARLEQLDAAKSTLFNLMMEKRLFGETEATDVGYTAFEDRKAPPRKPLLPILNAYRKRMFMRPSRKHATQVFALLGGLSLAGWVSPSSAGSIGLINTVSAMAFMYNRGEADVPTDDMGQPGEIRPMSKRPMALTALVTAITYALASLKSKSIIAAMVSPPKSLAVVLRTTLVSWALILPSLFFTVHWIEDEDFEWLKFKKKKT
jgi:hypothetical protein